MTDFAVNMTNGPGAVQRDESVLRSAARQSSTRPGHGS